MLSVAEYASLSHTFDTLDGFPEPVAVPCCAALCQGFYDPKSKLVFRALAVKERRLDDALIASRLQRALKLRQRLFDGSQTTGVCRHGEYMGTCKLTNTVLLDRQACVGGWVGGGRGLQHKMKEAPSLKQLR